VPLAGLWEFPGGKVQPNETLANAAARECFEETDIAVEVGREYPPVEHDYAHDRVELHFFRCAPLDPERLPRDPFRWMAAAELADLEFPPVNRAILDDIAGASTKVRR
jgi:mutator protein MutT